jgi:endonuclease-8
VPEGDTIHKTARTLAKLLAGRVVERCECELAAADDWAVTGRLVERVEARGKNLLIHCAPLCEAPGDRPAREGPELPLAIYTHMGMKGAWHSYRPGEPWQRPARQAAIVLHTKRRVVPCFAPEALEFLGPRGLLRHRVLASLGPDLLDPDANLDAAVERLRDLGPGVELGDAIMRQRAVAGIGNVYKSELLFLAGLDPFTPVSAVTKAELRSLLERARELMQRNLELAGKRRTRFSARDPRGRFWVYERSGRPCRRCGELIAMRRQGELARSTYYCPRCQSP